MPLQISPPKGGNGQYIITIGGGGSGGVGPTPKAAGGGGGNSPIMITSMKFEPVSPKWEPWYAWYPRNINGKWHWLSTAYRKKIYTHDPGFGTHGKFTWEYGTVFDKLKEE